jgi:hypothetical protein
LRQHLSFPYYGAPFLGQPVSFLGHFLVFFQDLLVFFQDQEPQLALFGKRALRMLSA